jgi:hypothetical protein
MKRLLVGLLISSLAVVTAGCAGESATVEDENEPDLAGVVLVGIDQYGEEEPLGTSQGGNASSRIETPHASCQGCGPVPDPWKSIVGPVPDPWDPDPPADPSANGSGGADGHSKRKR